jgi:hypothetical protein
MCIVVNVCALIYDIKHFVLIINYLTINLCTLLPSYINITYTLNQIFCTIL